MNSMNVQPAGTVEPEAALKFPASIEVTVKKTLELDALEALFPKGTQVYLPDIGVDSEQDIVRAARRLIDSGYQPVAHIPVRRIPDQQSMERRLRSLADQGVSDCLVIAGEEKKAGGYRCSEDLLKTGLLDSVGYKKVAIAGHPEINTAYPKGTETEILLGKVELAQHSDAEFRITTQFGFDTKQMHEWAASLRLKGVDLPLHMGIAGPTKLTTLIKFAARCGVGNSLSFLKKRSSALAALATTYNPEDMAGELEQLNFSGSRTVINQLHVFPFGGIESSSNWLYQRGSW